MKLLSSLFILIALVLEFLTPNKTIEQSSLYGTWENVQDTKVLRIISDKEWIDIYHNDTIARSPYYLYGSNLDSIGLVIDALDTLIYHVAYLDSYHLSLSYLGTASNLNGFRDVLDYRKR